MSTNENQAKQLCPGQYGAISLGVNSTLNLNGGVYQVTRLTLADGARLEPSEPVVILVSGGVTTGIGSSIRPSAQSINPMTAADIRIEVGGASRSATAPRSALTCWCPPASSRRARTSSLTGAAWAKTINIGTQSFVGGEGVFSAQAPRCRRRATTTTRAPADTCVGTGAAAFCSNTPAPTGTSCEDGNACNGAERCDAAGQCQPGTPVSAGTSCADDNACNGDETCNGIGTCVPGTPPVVSDGNSCTTDSCDPATGVSHVPVPDGTTCSGVGTCEAGICSVKGTVFSADFFQFQSAPAQCDSWNDFLGNQLTDGTYSSVTMNGTFDPTGVTCTDPAAATQICQALHHGSFTSVFCDGHSWNIGQCGGTELNIDFGVCFCNSPGRTIRPCEGEFWGGVNTDTCGGPNQNITVVCE